MHRTLLALALVTGTALVIACSQGPPTPPPPTAPPASPAAAGATTTAGTTPTQTAPAATAAPKVALASEIRMGMALLGDGIEPHTTASQASSIPIEQTFDGLTRLDVEGVMIPALATSWRPVDATTWEFALRPGVRFQNGDPMTAEDVKFTIERLLDPAAGLTVTNRMTTIAGADVINPNTVRIRTNAPDPLLPARMNLAKILPARHFQSVDLDTFVRNPIGTGPWKVREISQGSYILWDAFADSWRGAPKMPAARILRIPEAATLAAASRTGEIDIAYELAADSEQEVLASGQVDIKVIERTSTIIVDLNWFPNTGGIAPFADKRVRHALNYAVDKEALNRALEGNYAKIAQGQLVTPGTVGYNPNLQPYPYDVARARALLAEAGQTGGFSATMLVTPGINAQTGVAVGGFLQPLGITVSLDQSEFPVFLQKYNSGNRGPMFLWGPGFANFLDADQSLSFFESTVNPNIRRLDNPQFDAVMARSKTELDAARRNQLLQEAAAILREEVPFILLYQRGVLLGVNKKVSNFELRRDNGIHFDNLVRER